MKKLFTLLTLCLFLPLQACAVEQWQEGTHYKVLNEKASATPEIVEFFSFYCPHCYNFEPIAADIKKKMGDDVEFRKVHVNFMGSSGRDVQNALTRAMMVGRTLKEEDRLNGAIFNHIHRQRGIFTSLTDAKNVFIVNGIEGAEFDKLAQSFGVNSMVKKNNNDLEKYRKHVNSVPTVIVNGKYLSTFTRDMTPADIADLIVWLSKLSK